MTLEEFKKVITRSSWFDKYYYYFISLAIIGIGLFFIYEGFFHLSKYPNASSRNLMSFVGLFLVVLGSISLSLIPNRYKILKFTSSTSTDVKKRIIAETMKEFGGIFIDDQKCFWSFNYQRRWWTSDYIVYLSFDRDSIFASVVGATYGRGGFIDFGQTEKFRKKINAIITEKINHSNIL